MFDRVLKTLKDQEIGVIGDVMVDHYVFGNVERISQEAPTPLVRVEKEERRLGGAANAAANIRAFGARVALLGAVGDDEEGAWLKEMLDEKDIDHECVVSDASRITTRKMRILAMNQQILRIDREKGDSLPSFLEKRLIAMAQERIPGWGAVMVSDYSKGMVTKRMADVVWELAWTHHKPLVVNAKPNHFSFFKNVTLLTPNKKEAEEVMGVSLITDQDIKNAGDAMRKRFRSSVLITRGAKGMDLFEGARHTHLPAVAREVYDTTGASDTVAATITAALAAGASLADAVKVANYAAGIVVGKVGTAAITAEELRENLKYAKEI